MNAIQVFSNQDFTVRTTRDTDGTVWFVAKDIAQALEYSEATIKNNISNLFSVVPDCWAGNKQIIVRSDNGIEQTREMLCLTEQGVYFFLGRSDKPKALPYQMWIAGDVVPSIRETGGYNSHKSTDMFALEGASFMFSKLGIEGNQQVLALDKIYRQQTGFSALETAGIQLVAPQQTQLLNPTDIGKHFGLNARQVNNILIAEDYQRRLENGKYEPTDKGKPYAVMLDTSKHHGDGTPVRQLKWDSSILDALEIVLEVSA